jgi:hypothetical protein
MFCHVSVALLLDTQRIPTGWSSRAASASSAVTTPRGSTSTTRYIVLLLFLLVTCQTEVARRNPRVTRFYVWRCFRDNILHVGFGTHTIPINFAVDRWGLFAGSTPPTVYFLAHTPTLQTPSSPKHPGTGTGEDPHHQKPLEITVEYPHKVRRTSSS